MSTLWPDALELTPVSRQSELDAVLRIAGIPIVVARGLFVVAADAVVHAVAGVLDAREHAHVYARGAAKVRAQDDARAWAAGSVHVDAYDRAVVVATGRARVRAADQSEVIGRGLATVTSLDDADVVGRDRVSVHAGDRSRVAASGWARVFAHGDVVVRASDRSSVWAYDRAAVWAENSVTVEVDGHAVSIHRCIPPLGAEDDRERPFPIDPTAGSRGSPASRLSATPDPR
jgi:hypothetical protein